MTSTEIIAQAISLIAMGFNCISYLQRKKSTLLVCQLIGSVLFGINYLLLGAIAGAILNVMSIIRAVVFLRSDKLHTENIYWTVGFITAYLSSYVMIFTIFDKEPTVPHLIVEFLPVAAMILFHLGLRYTETKMVRRLGLVSSPLWLAYNIASFSIGAIACEALNLVSIVIGMIRHDFKKK